VELAIDKYFLRWFSGWLAWGKMSLMWDGLAIIFCAAKDYRLATVLLILPETLITTQRKRKNDKGGAGKILPDRVEIFPDTAKRTLERQRSFFLWSGIILVG
jgi:hypothetical protein